METLEDKDLGKIDIKREIGKCVDTFLTFESAQRHSDLSFLGEGAC